MPAGDTHSRRLSLCAGEFSELKGETAQLRAADVQHSKAMEKLTETIEGAQSERREDHKELVGKLDGFILDHENRVTKVEESTGSAHHRLNTVHKILMTFGGGAGLTLLAWVMSKVIP